jgi:AcrR family transcriptional regulator
VTATPRSAPDSAAPTRASRAGASPRGGVRERKRRATRNAIQRAALTLSLDWGFDRITVEEISRAAQVSSRTFFNYFATKEAAVVGDMPTLPVGPAVERFVTAGDQPILDGIRDLLLGTVDALPDPDDVDIEQLRRQLLREYPSLFSVRMAGMRQLELDLAGLVERRLVRDDPEGIGRSDALHDRARLVTFVAFAGIRHAWTTWAESGGQGALADRITQSFVELREVVIAR